MRLALLTLAFAVTAGSAVAYTWGTVGTVSNTNANRVCVGYPDADADVTCPSYSPSITTAGDVSVSGALEATRFIGDGSGLSGINVSAATDRISTSGVSSGATLGMVVADKGTVSFTLAGTEGAAYMHPTYGLVIGGISTTTNQASFTTVYASGRIGIGTTTPTAAVHIQPRMYEAWGQALIRQLVPPRQLRAVVKGKPKHGQLCGYSCRDVTEAGDLLLNCAHKQYSVATSPPAV